ncbi:hypothetical protein VTL71DRAFT_4063 [Oculimacula yallundae]|uniref:Mg2+ transporter protein, CorA-like/Zinc transport protein ZntB n=1 Tax=Oculimacula yallundae TaxID=86028 RepID=A0ABR4C4R4_9HELO
MSVATLSPDQHGDLSAFAPDSVPLPDSRPDSLLSPSTSSKTSSAKRSLDFLLIAEASGSQALDDAANPSMVPLPESQPDSTHWDDSTELEDHPARQISPIGSSHMSINSHPNPPQRAEIIRLPPSLDRETSYKALLDGLAHVLTHLENGRTLKPVTTHTAKLEVIDFDSRNECTRRQPYNFNDSDIFDFSLTNNPNTALETVPQDVTRRLMIIEDLCPELIQFMVINLGLSPDFFEEHLVNSGYGGTLQKETVPHSWRSSSMKKSYISIKWYRPVWRLPRHPFSKQDLEDLLDPGIGNLQFSHDRSRDLRIQLESNIFRPEWDLWTDLRTTSRQKRLCGWEERASIWKGKIPGNNDCDLVVLLLDPMPSIKKSMVRFVPKRKQGARHHEVQSISTVLSGTDISGIPEDEEAGQNETQRTGNGNDQPALISRRRYAAKRRFKLLPEWIIGLLGLGGGLEGRRKEFISATLTQPVIEQIGSRVPISIGLEDVIRDTDLVDGILGCHIGSLFSTDSTLDTFNNYLDSSAYGETKPHFGILNPLFGIVRRDVAEFLKLLDGILDGIILDILDDSKMEDQLAIWRQILTRAQLELPQMRRSMIKFFTFLPLPDMSSDTDDWRVAITDDPDFQSLISDIDESLKRLNSVSSSLTSNMALLDSRRSIEEAQSITRLTELAFLFIPLTFAATLFGMQVDQFKDPVPLSTFIILAIVLSGFSYGVRLAIRSSWLLMLKHSSKESIKSYADRRHKAVQGGYISTSLFLQWSFITIWLQLKYIIVGIASFLASMAIFAFRLAVLLISPFELLIKPLACVGLVCVLPLSLLWTRPVDPGIQVAITVACVSSVSILVFALFWRSADEERRSVIPKLLVKAYRLFSRENSVLLVVVIYAGVASVFLVPVALLWTSPTAAGLKAALMAVLTFVVLIFGAVLAIYYNVMVADDLSYDSDDESGSGSSGSLADD